MQKLIRGVSEKESRVENDNEIFDVIKSANMKTDGALCARLCDHLGSKFE